MSGLSPRKRFSIRIGIIILPAQTSCTVISDIPSKLPYICSVSLNFDTPPPKKKGVTLNDFLLNVKPKKNDKGFETTTDFVTMFHPAPGPCYVAQQK